MFPVEWNVGDQEAMKLVIKKRKYMKKMGPRITLINTNFHEYLLKILLPIRVIRHNSWIFVILLSLSIAIIACASTANYPNGDFYAIVVSDTHVSRDESKIERLNKLSEMRNYFAAKNMKIIK